MIRMILFIALCCFAVVGKAQIIDAFNGIIPVTDFAMKRSLNGMWQLKVVKGITNDQSVPPICYPQVGSYFRKFNYNFPKVADIYTPHYPTTSQLKDFYQHADRPVIFTEYLHTLGISFEDHDRQWEIIERTPCIAGGSVWEWVDQGMPFRGKKSEGRGKMFGYEERVFTSNDSGFEMYGNKGTDGLLYADRTEEAVSPYRGDTLPFETQYDTYLLRFNDIYEQ